MSPDIAPYPYPYLSFFLGIMYFIAPIAIVVLAIWFIFTKVKVARRNGISQKKVFDALKEEIVSQSFFLLSIFFSGLTINSINIDLDGQLSVQSILFFMLIFSIIISYLIRASATLVLGLVLFIIWWIVQTSIWTREYSINDMWILSSMSLIFLVMFLLGNIHQNFSKYKKFSEIYTVFGISPITGILLFFSTTYGLHALNGSAVEASILDGITLPFMLILSIFSSLIALVIYALYKRSIYLGELLATILFAMFFFTLAILPPQSIFIERSRFDYLNFESEELSANGIIFSILFNVVSFAQIVSLLFLGYRRKKMWIVNTGAMFLFFFILSKYFDWFFTFLDKSLFFIGAGIIMFGIGAIMEKGRLIVIKNIN